MRTAVFFVVILTLLSLTAVARAEPAAAAADGNPLKQAKDLIKKNRFEEAAGLCTGVLASEPGNAEALTRRAQAYTAAGRYDEALKDLDELVRLHPGNRAHLLERARVRQAKGSLAEAVADCSAAIALKKDGQAFELRAQIYEKARQFEEALADYSEAVKHQPFRPDLYIARGKLYRATGDRHRAGLDFGQAMRLNPRYSAVVQRTLAEAGVRTVEKPSLSFVTSSDPMVGGAPDVKRKPDPKLMVVGKAVKQQKRETVNQPGDAKAAESAEPQLTLAQKAAGALSAGPTRRGARQAPGSETAAEPASVPDPTAMKRPEDDRFAQEKQLLAASLQAGRDQFAAANYTAAIASFTKVIELRPKQAEGYTRRCAANYLAGNAAAAAADCAKAIEVNAREADAHFYQGRIYLDAKDYAKGIASLDAALEAKPHFPEAHFYRGTAFQALDDLAQAIYSFSEASRQKQGYVEALEARAAIKLLLGDKLGHQADSALIAGLKK